MKAIKLALALLVAAAPAAAQPAVKVNGRAFLYTGRESGTSFGVAIDLGTVEMLKEADPDTYWRTPHDEGRPAVLARYGSKDPGRVREIIRRSHGWTAAKPRPRLRRTK